MNSILKKMYELHLCNGKYLVFAITTPGISSASPAPGAMDKLSKENLSDWGGPAKSRSPGVNAGGVQKTSVKFEIPGSSRGGEETYSYSLQILD